MKHFPNKLFKMFGKIQIKDIDPFDVSDFELIGQIKKDVIALYKRHLVDVNDMYKNIYYVYYITDSKITISEIPHTFLYCYLTNTNDMKYEYFYNYIIQRTKQIMDKNSNIAVILKDKEFLYTIDLHFDIFVCLDYDKIIKELELYMEYERKNNFICYQDSKTIENMKQHLENSPDSVIDSNNFNVELNRIEGIYKNNDYTFRYNEEFNLDTLPLRLEILRILLVSDRIKTDTLQFNKIREIFTKDDIMNMDLEYLIRLVI